jgi:hypothetical protein
MQDEARLNQLETQPVGFWKRFGTGLLQRAITRRGEAPIPITKRQRDIEQTRGQLARDLKLGQEEGQMSSEEALQRQRELEPVFQQQRLEQEQGIQNARLEIERQKAAGEITRREADRQQKELDRQSREKIAAANVASREKVAGLRGTGGGLTPYQQQEIGDREAKREAARQAASDEYDQLVRDEVTAGKEKDRLYGVLKTIKENPAYPKEDLQQAQNDADEADKIYKSFAGKKRDALTRVRENQRATPAAAPKQQTQGGIYSGKRFSRAKVAERAKSLGMTPEQAEKTITAGGGIIY